MDINNSIHIVNITNIPHPGSQNMRLQLNSVSRVQTEEGFEGGHSRNNNQFRLSRNNFPDTQESYGNNYDDGDRITFDENLLENCDLENYNVQGNKKSVLISPRSNTPFSETYDVLHTSKLQDDIPSQQINKNRNTQQNTENRNSTQKLIKIPRNNEYDKFSLQRQVFKTDRNSHVATAGKNDYPRDGLVMIKRLKLENKQVGTTIDTMIDQSTGIQTAKEDQNQPKLHSNVLNLNSNNPSQTRLQLSSKPTKASGSGSFQYYFQISPIEEHANRLSVIKNKILLLNNTQTQFNNTQGQFNLTNKNEIQAKQFPKTRNISQIHNIDVIMPQEQHLQQNYYNSSQRKFNSTVFQAYQSLLSNRGIQKGSPTKIDLNKQLTQRYPKLNYYQSTNTTTQNFNKLFPVIKPTNIIELKSKQQTRAQSVLGKQSQNLIIFSKNESLIQNQADGTNNQNHQNTLKKFSQLNKQNTDEKNLQESVNKQNIQQNLSQRKVSQKNKNLLGELAAYLDTDNDLYIKQQQQFQQQQLKQNKFLYQNTGTSSSHLQKLNKVQRTMMHFNSARDIQQGIQKNNQILDFSDQNQENHQNDKLKIQGNLYQTQTSLIQNNQTQAKNTSDILSLLNLQQFTQDDLNISKGQQTSKQIQKQKEQLSQREIAQISSRLLGEVSQKARIQLSDISKNQEILMGNTRYEQGKDSQRKINKLITKQEKLEFQQMSQVRAKSILQSNRKGLQSFTSSEIFGSYSLAQQQMVKNDIIKIGQSEFANKIYDDIIPNRNQYYPRNSSLNNQQKYLSLDHNSDNFFQNNLDLNLSQESLNDIKKIRENLLLSERRIREKKKQQEKQFYSELPRSTLPETLQNEYSIQVRGPGEAYQDNFEQNPDGNLLPVIFDQSKLQPFKSQNYEQTIENLDSQHEYHESDMLKSPDQNIEVTRQQSQISLLQLKGKDILKKYQKYNPAEDEYSLYLKLMNKVRKMKAGHKVFNRLKIPVQPPPQEQNVNNSGIITKVQNQQDIQKALNNKRSMNSLEKASKIKAKT